MKVLIVDDQQLVLLSLEKYLNDLGYETKCADNIFDAVQYYDSFNPDLAIIDINMSVSPNAFSPQNTISEIENKDSGLEVLKYIRFVKKHTTPVMILSGNVDDDILEKGFELGANEYIKKPLSLKEIGIRVKRLIGDSSVNENTKDVTVNNRMIQNSCIGVVIPCHNEEKWLLSEEFRNFVFKNLGYHLCFVNDGENTIMEHYHDKMAFIKKPLASENLTLIMELLKKNHDKKYQGRHCLHTQHPSPGVFAHPV